MLALDEAGEWDAQEKAGGLGVRLFSAEITYHWFDAFTRHWQDSRKQNQEEFKPIALLPWAPGVQRVTGEADQEKQGHLCADLCRSWDGTEINHRQVDVAKRGQEVCVNTEPTPDASPKHMEGLLKPQMLLSVRLAAVQPSMPWKTGSERKTT